MTIQIHPSVTNPTVASIYQDIMAQNLILKPDFQRKFVWTHEHQEDFIDTIVKGLPFPEIYVCEGDVDVAKLRTIRYVIDGQQRLTTIVNFIDGKYDKPLKKCPPFQDLNENEKRDFLSYKVVVRDLGRIDDELIREVFRRINLTKFKLEDIEIHNAVYDGAFIQTGKEILSTIDLSGFGVFRESEFTRMADLHFILLVMSTIENKGYFSQDRELENFINNFNEEYQNSDTIQTLLFNTFNTIKDLQLQDDSIWFRKSNFFTLVVEIAKNDGALSENAKKKLLDLERNILKNKHNKGNKFGKYYGYMYAGTNNRQARVVRSEILVEHLFN